MSTVQEMGKTIAGLNAVALAMQTENQRLKDSLGVVGPRGRAEKYGFMSTNTMQVTAPCECRSFTNGVGEGVGIGVGIGVTVAVAWTLLSLLKSR